MDPEYERAIEVVRALAENLESDHLRERQSALESLADRGLATLDEHPARVAARIGQMNDQQLMTALTPDVGRPN